MPQPHLPDRRACCATLRRVGSATTASPPHTCLTGYRNHGTCGGRTRLLPAACSWAIVRGAFWQCGGSGEREGVERILVGGGQVLPPLPHLRFCDIHRAAFPTPLPCSLPVS